MEIKLEQVMEAIETAYVFFTYFYDTQAYETVYFQGEIITGGRNEELEELSCSYHRPGVWAVLQKGA